ncbi:hypothetical protein [Nocardia noduli]|uniref:hypothetical protein n=1 Tax=Nocardia noduli TaxID=2815722 RepID=UPI001C21C8A1|nr:hypothetical protein [Nocardia noduli]
MRRRREQQIGRRRLGARDHRPFRFRDGDDLRELPPLPRGDSCVTGKVRYLDSESAEMVLSGIDRSDPRRREQRTYLCPSCTGWHLTSQAFKPGSEPSNR